MSQPEKRQMTLSLSCEYFLMKILGDLGKNGNTGTLEMKSKII